MRVMKLSDAKENRSAGDMVVLVLSHTKKKREIRGWRGGVQITHSPKSATKKNVMGMWGRKWGDEKGLGSGQHKMFGRYQCRPKGEGGKKQ